MKIIHMNSFLKTFNQWAENKNLNSLLSLVAFIDTCIHMGVSMDLWLFKYNYLHHMAVVSEWNYAITHVTLTAK